MENNLIVLMFFCLLAFIISEAYANDRELISLNKKNKCLPQPAMVEAKCNELIAKGCPMSWVGKGSCHKCQDGGCQLNTFCGFISEEKCKQFKYRGCVWTGLACFGPTLKPTKKPTRFPTSQPTTEPTTLPTSKPTTNPTSKPTKNPTLNPTSKPTLNPTKNTNVVGAVTTGFYYSCALLINSSMKCWGDNSKGQLGDGTTTNRNDPSTIAAINLGTRRHATSIYAGFLHTCALLDDSSMKCWGDNSKGQLGDGTTTNRNDPSTIAAINLGTGRHAISMSAGAYYTCALLDDSSMKCWGDNSKGQLGDGTTTDRNNPSTIAAINMGTGRHATSMSAGDRHTCALLDDSSMKCWGYNIYGQLGDGTTTDQNDPNTISAIIF